MESEKVKANLIIIIIMVILGFASFKFASRTIMIVNHDLVIITMQGRRIKKGSLVKMCKEEKANPVSKDLFPSHGGKSKADALCFVPSVLA